MIESELSRTGSATLSRIARFGTLRCAPGSYTFLADVGRSRLHAGTVKSLLNRDFVWYTPNENIELTLSGLTQLIHERAIGKLPPTESGAAIRHFTKDGVFVRVAARNYPSTREAVRIAHNVRAQLLRLVDEQPALWQLTVELALVNNEGGILGLFLDGIEVASPRSELGWPDVDVTMLAVAPEGDDEWDEAGNE